MRGLVLALSIVTALAPAAGTLAQPEVPPVIVIGIDGMDPLLLDGYVARGLMPNFARLMAEGSYAPLGTSVPPQSPVAWSNFITGMDPGGHGIFDFIHRDPANYMPTFSAALVTEPDKTLSIGDWVIPLSAGGTHLLRKGEAFWQILERRDVPYTIFRVPANFPPAPSRGHTISGMGTPDLLGTYGTFSFYTDDDLYRGIDVSGGEVYPVEVRDGRVAATLVGPENSLRRGRPNLERPFTVDIDAENQTALFTVGDERFVLEVGEWSEWNPVHFDLVGPLKGLSGIARFHLQSVTPRFELYVTPINIDPADPALPISTPESYSREIYERIGRFYTQGMPEDTKALEYGMLDDAEFVAQTDIVLEERWRMLGKVLDDYAGGFLFFYVSTVDQSCHALWRNDDAEHPAHTPELSFEERFEFLYAQMDSLLGAVRARAPADATIIVMSDHGFAPYYYRVHLNTWLYENGYLSLLRPDEMGQHPLFGNVFWRRTQAYALGINGLYVNMLGREGKGIVRRGEQSNTLLDEISAKLLAWRHEETGERVVTRVYRREEIYHGEAAADGPDLVIGYNRGYRGSDESALGTVHPELLSPNLGKWTGDHCMDHTLVPGVLLVNRELSVADPDLRDLPVSILSIYGVDVPPQMTGRVLFTQ